MIASNSFTVYYHEIDTLNRNESLVYDTIKKTSSISTDDIMHILNISERNSVAPRVSDLLRKNLIKIVGNKINKLNHTVNMFSITTSGEFKAPKKTDLKSLKKRVVKLSRNELNELFEYILELNRE
jgi:predicted metal-dependent hydrolase